MRVVIRVVDRSAIGQRDGGQLADAVVVVVGQFVADLPAVSQPRGE